MFDAVYGGRVAVDLSEAQVEIDRRARGGPGDGAAAHGLDSAPATVRALAFLSYGMIYRVDEREF
ncbi:MAG: hypothetical protein AAGA87_05815 [Pseudomonadota bacterium]